MWKVMYVMLFCKNSVFFQDEQINVSEETNLVE